MLENFKVMQESNDNGFMSILTQDDIKLTCPDRISTDQSLYVEWSIAHEDVECFINVTNGNISHTYTKLPPAGKIAITRFKGEERDITLTFVVKNQIDEFAKQKVIAVKSPKVMKELNANDFTNIIRKTDIKLTCPNQITADQDFIIKWSVTHKSVEDCFINVTNGNISHTYNELSTKGKITETHFRGIKNDITVTFIAKNQISEAAQQEIIRVENSEATKENRVKENNIPQQEIQTKSMKKIHLKRNNGYDESFFALIGFIQLIIGVIFLIPPIISAITYTCKIIGLGKWLISLKLLIIDWTGDANATSAALVYLGLMAIAGTFIVHSAVKNVISATKIVYGIDAITDMEITEE